MDTKTVNIAVIREKSVSTAISVVKWAGIIGGLAAGARAIFEGDLSTGVSLIVGAVSGV